jgi:hypothetical protein
LTVTCQQMSQTGSMNADRNPASDDVASWRGNAKAILQAMREPPHLTAADVDELDAAIATGRLALAPAKLEAD